MAENKQSQTKETQSVQREQVSIEKSLDQLARYGGFDLLETSIENVQNLNPDRKARRKIFLSEKIKLRSVRH